MALKDKFIFSKKFLINAGAALFTALFGLILIFWWLGFYTNHGEAFSVPNFEGLTVVQAQDLADDKDLNLKIIDSVYNAPGRRGTIIDQNPPMDFKVKSNRTIFVTIKSLQPEIIEMPNFVDLTLIQAKADIETYGLKIGELKYKPSKYDNLVLEQRYMGDKIEAGTEIAKGSAIDLVLGKSENMGSTNAPSILGLTEVDATLKAADNMLNIGAIIYDNTVKNYMDSINATVVRQDPVKNVPMRPGDEIDIWLSMKKDTTWHD